MRVSVCCVYKKEIGNTTVQYSDNFFPFVPSIENYKISFSVSLYFFAIRIYVASIVQPEGVGILIVSGLSI
jgi:hypothetical protein